MALTPEQQQALAGLDSLMADEASTQRQLAQIAALRGQQQAPRHSTALGSLFGGVGHILGGAALRNKERGLEIKREANAPLLKAAMEAQGLLRSTQQQQGLALGDQQLAEGQRKAAEAQAAAERAKAPVSGPLSGLLGQLAPGQDFSALTNQDVEAASPLARSVSAQRQAAMDRAAMKAQREAAMTAAQGKRAADVEERLRKEFTGNKVTKDALEVATSFEKVKRASQDETGASDMALIFSFMKILDPGSTVREGEYATAQNTGSIPDRVRGAYNRALTGERLAPEVRREFVAAAGQAFAGQMDQFRKFEDTYRGLARGSGADPARVAIPLGLDAAPAVGAAPAPASTATERKSVGGRTYEKRGGQWFEVGGG